MRLSYAIAALNREPKIRVDRLCNTLYYSPGDSWDKIEEEDSEPPAPRSMNTFRVQMIALSGGNATVKERANVVIIQPGTLVHTRISAAALPFRSAVGHSRKFQRSPASPQTDRQGRKNVNLFE